MDETKAGALTVDRDEPDPDWDHAFADVVGDLAPRPAPRVPEALGAELRCVSSGYLEHGCSCSASVPFAVASAALRRELAYNEKRGDRFFRFAWRDEVWLAYGLGDGRLRGVYCPSHSAERDRRAFAAGLLVDESPRALAVGA